MPHALELPGMLRPIVKLMRLERLASLRRDVVDELVALSLGHAVRRCPLSRRSSRLVPRLAAIVRSLNDLPEPSAGLRSINSIGIRGRSLEVVQLPPRKVRTADFPVIPL